MTLPIRETVAVGLTMLTTMSASLASPAQDASTVAAIDTHYQAAVKRNDADAMARILHDDFVLVLGDGSTHTKNDLLRDVREKKFIFEQQDEEPGTQKVRVWGDTAVVTAKLWLKYQRGDKAFERKLWFSDTYVRTADGWRYVFGQASLALPGLQ